MSELAVVDDYGRSLVDSEKLVTFKIDGQSFRANAGAHWRTFFAGKP